MAPSGANLAHVDTCESQVQEKIKDQRWKEKDKTNMIDYYEVHE